MKIAINGFGRIGRTFFRAAYEKKLDIVAVNDLADIKTLVHLLKYDSTYGHFEGKLETGEGEILVDNKSIVVLSEKDPAKIPWSKLGVDLVIEATGVFCDYEGGFNHYKSGAKNVIISAPVKGDKKVKTIVLGMNEEKFNPKEDKVVSMASCTTNCLVPVADVLHRNFGIKKSSMTTIHSYTMDQRLQDDAHKDLRRARSATVSIIPTTTGATSAAAEVLPELRGKMDGLSYRVPTATVSVIDFVALVSKSTTVKEVNQAFIETSQDPKYSSGLAVTDEPLVSTDFKGDSHGAIVDLLSTQVIDDTLVRVVAWYDNEMGYSKRLVEFCKYIESKI